MVIHVANVLMIIAPEKFRDEELFHTKDALEKAKHNVIIASTSTEEAHGMLGGKVKPEITIDKVDIKNYDAIIFVGGSGAAVYFNDKTAISIAKKAYSSGKVVAAICIAPSILANAGILNSTKATSYPSEKENLESNGALYQSEPVVTDGKIVTANGPAAATNFGKAISKLIKS